MSAPPPPPPHGEVPRSSGLPPGKYDIFVIPEHSAGGGFLYLPSMKPSVNSFVAGFACALILVALFQSMAPAFMVWWDGFQGLGNMGITMLIFGVGFGAWALGRTQNDGPTARASGAHRGGPGSGPGGFGASNSAPPPHAGASPPPPPRHGPSSQAPPPQPPPPPPPQPSHHDAPPPPRREKPENTWEQKPASWDAPEAEAPRAEPPKAETPKPDTPKPDIPKPDTPKPETPKPQTPKPETPKPEVPKPEASKAKGSWEKAREEMRKKEEERKAKAAETKRREEVTRRLAELRAKEAKDRLEREKEKERKEAEKKKELAEQRKKEALEKLERESRERAAQQREASPKKESTATTATANSNPTVRGGSYAFSSLGEKTNMWPNGRPSVAPSEASAASSKMPRSEKRPPAPTARTCVNEEDDGYSYRPYDQPKKHNRKPSVSSIGESEASWAASQTTAQTSPPPSMRGPYSTKDPDKIVIQAVYLFMNQFAKTPASQLISGVGSVTDGLILRMTTEGLFIDDDVRGVPQREWDVKAWTLKKVEVWCPPHCLSSCSGFACSKPAAGDKKPHVLYKTAPTTRNAGRDGCKVMTGDEADSYLIDMLRACNSCCRRGLCERELGDTDIQSPSGQTGQWRAKGLHVLRATVRDAEGKRYMFVLDETESWKVVVGLQRLRRGTQVRQLGVSGMAPSEARGALETLGWCH
ncbi:hypothetical protein CDD82_431 [Ophiocordyceps australis]|uniref:Trans-sialidase n=1 Tax=Ophiocordyceps australis TaxID=1399860 RepID=A0A2C5ZUC5_9HYPO|nr:hypothetical protein CDD82_431 [Ophiocordyceps australis]